MVFCEVCKENGEEDSVCKTHSSTNRAKCRWHARHPAATRKTPVKTRTRTTPDVDGDLQSLSFAPLGDVSDSVATLSSRGVDHATIESKTPPELLQMLFNGELAKQDVIQQLALRLSVQDISTKVELQLERTLKTVKSYDPVEGTESKSTNEAAKQVALLQSKHGKFVGALLAVHKRITHELHINKRSTNKQIYEHAETGERIVESTPHGEIESVEVFTLVLIDFCYLCTAHDYLSPTECRALQRWVAKQLYVGITHYVVLFRVVERLLQELDVDLTRNLGDVIDARSTRYEEEESALFTPPRSVPTRGQYVQGANYSKLTPGDSKLAVPWPRKGICFCWTNGFDCEELDHKGSCKFLASHGTCGKQIKDSTGATVKCKGKHRASECPH